MPLERPEDGVLWVQVPLDRPLELQVTGEAHSWWTHWARPGGRGRPVAVRCLRFEKGECEWCGCGYERRVRYVMPVWSEGQDRLLELGRVQYPALLCIAEMHGLPGSILSLSRERPALNSPIVVRLVRHEAVQGGHTRDCTEVVAILGGVAGRMMDPHDGEAQRATLRRK